MRTVQLDCRGHDTRIQTHKKPPEFIATQPGFISPVDFFFFCQAQAAIADTFFPTRCKLTDRCAHSPAESAFAGEAPHIQVIADRPQVQILGTFLPDQSWYRVSRPECKRQFQLIGIMIRNCTMIFPFFMRKQFSVKPPRSLGVADHQDGLASFFPSTDPLANCIGAYSDNRSDFITLQPFWNSNTAYFRRSYNSFELIFLAYLSYMSAI